MHEDKYMKGLKEYDLGGTEPGTVVVWFAVPLPRKRQTRREAGTQSHNTCNPASGLGNRKEKKQR